MGSMYMCNDMLNGDLLTTSYKSYWSVTGDSDKDSSRRLSHENEEPDVGCRFKQLTDSEVICCSTDTENDHTNNSMVFKTGFAKLDKTTLKLLGWSSGALESQDDYYYTDEHTEKNKENIRKLSKVEFRRLSEQVRDVSMNLRNKFRTSAYQKLYQQQQQAQCIQQQLLQQQGYLPENGTQIYRSQLAASLRAFKPKDWTPLKGNETDTTFFRCKPLNCTVGDRPLSRGSSPPSRLCRPRSTPLTNTRPPSAFRKCDTPTDVRPGNFDTLTPNVLANLINTSYKGAPTYGDRVPSEEDSTEEKDAKKSISVKDDDVSTSGVDSTHSVDDSTGDSSEEDDSDYEPSLDHDRDVPELNLRPEKLDSLVVPDSAKGWRKFDFDANDVDVPPYEFVEPLPEPFRDIDLRQVARLKWSWRDQTKERPQDAEVEDILDRLIELERIQMETEDWEQKRSTQLLSRRAKRIMSAKQAPKDKRCCGKCLQPACTGDCPEKFVQSDITCDLCRQSYCNGTCKDTKYDQRMRQPRTDDDKSVQSKPPLPRNCKTCQVKHNGKLINANNLVLGRPKSGNVTYSRGAASLKPKDLRPRSETHINSEVIRDFEKLGIEPYQSCRPTTARLQRPRSRNGIIPGKSFSSQRRDSLTEIDKNVAKLNRKKAKSVRLRRPKTAL